MAINIARRKFIATLGGTALAWPLVARAQQPDHMRRIAILSDFSDLEMQPLIATFCEQLQQLGWGDDSIRIDTRLGITGAAQFQEAAAALVGVAPDVIVTLGSPALRAMKQETSTIPIVFTFVADPVGQGLVASLAHPGGNATGFTNFEFSFAGKWLEALKEIEPGISRGRAPMELIGGVAALQEGRKVRMFASDWEASGESRVTVAAGGKDAHRRSRRAFQSSRCRRHEAAAATAHRHREHAHHRP